MSDMLEDGLEMTGESTPALEKTRRYADTLATSADATGLDETVTAELPVVDNAQLPTQKGVQAISISSRLSLPFIDGSSIADQPTWELPVIPGPRRSGNHVGLPATQDNASENGQTSSDTQGYLPLAFDMIKSSGIYAVGALASPLVSLILTPFLAHHLSRTEYGGLAVLYTVIDLVTVITQLGLSASFFRAYNSDYESQHDRLGVLATSIILLSLASIPIAVAMMLAAPWLSSIARLSVSP